MHAYLECKGKYITSNQIALDPESFHLSIILSCFHQLCSLLWRCYFVDFTDGHKKNTIYWDKNIYYSLHTIHNLVPSCHSKWEKPVCGCMLFFKKPLSDIIIKVTIQEQKQAIFSISCYPISDGFQFVLSTLSINYEIIAILWNIDNENYINF